MNQMGRETWNRVLSNKGQFFGGRGMSEMSLPISAADLDQCDACTRLARKTQTRHARRQGVWPLKTTACC